MASAVDDCTCVAGVEWQHCGLVTFDQWWNVFIEFHVSMISLSLDVYSRNKVTGREKVSSLLSNDTSAWKGILAAAMVTMWRLSTWMKGPIDWSQASCGDSYPISKAHPLNVVCGTKIGSVPRSSKNLVAPQIVWGSENSFCSAWAPFSLPRVGFATTSPWSRESPSLLLFNSKDVYHLQTCILIFLSLDWGLILTS